MWLYILYGTIAVIIVGLAVVAYLMYKGYNKIKPKPLGGIPTPPLTHALGHPDKVLSPIKHALRLDVCEAARAKYHQLVFMQMSSVFINDAQEAARLVKDMPSKGPIYNAFRLNPAIPDILASDGDAWKLRNSALRPALESLMISETQWDKLLSDLADTLKKFSESGETLNICELFSFFAFDVVCLGAFGYELNGLQGSEQANKLYNCIKTLTAWKAGQGLYAVPNARKVPEAEMKEHSGNWKEFLCKLVAKVKADCEEFKSKHGELDPTRYFSHSLVSLSESAGDAYGDAEMMGDIHQILRHGYECISGTCYWLVYALFKFPKIRAKLEETISSQAQQAAGHPEYLECFIKETLRRYPVAGNSTVRTVETEDFKLASGNMISYVPPNITLHMHMYSLHNTTREWEKPKEFLPDRWIELDPSSISTGEEGQSDEPEPTFPKCPFMSTATQSEALSSLKKSSSSLAAYEGVGFDPDSLSFFPFSAGHRSCPGKGLVLDALRRVVAALVVSYRLDPAEPFDDEDTGISQDAIIIPLLPMSTKVKVTRAVDLGKVPKKKIDDGWADDEGDDSKIANDGVETSGDGSE